MRAQLARLLTVPDRSLSDIEVGIVFGFCVGVLFAVALELGIRAL